MTGKLITSQNGKNHPHKLPSNFYLSRQHLIETQILKASMSSYINVYVLIDAQHFTA